MMYNPQLDTFICVVEAGSFSKAAEELYISAPGCKISDSIFKRIVDTGAGSNES